MGVVQAVVVDVPACIRSSMTRDSSPAFLARQLLRRLKKNYGDFEHLECYFDDSSQMHEKRQQVALVRASRSEALTDADVRSIDALQLGTISPGHLTKEMPWDILLRSTDTKMVCWELLARCLFKYALLEGVTSVKVQSQNYNDQCGETTTTVVRWGEADMSCAMAAVQLDNVLIATIDYDMVLQSLIGMPAASAGTRYVGFKTECIDSGLLSTMYGNEDQRLHASVLLLCAFKSDYSKPICKKVGMTTKALVEHMQKPAGRACLVERTEGGKRCLVFRPPYLATCLRKLPPIELIADILWCISYFRGFGSANTPPSPAVDIVPDLLLKPEHIICYE